MPDAERARRQRPCARVGHSAQIGVAGARNLGARQAQGRYLVFIDADVCVHVDTLVRFVETFAKDPEIVGVVGTYDDAPADPGFISQYKNLFHRFVHKSFDGDLSTFWSGCGAVRRDVFLKFNGFDEIRYRRPAIEDIELGAWIAAAGHHIVLDSRVQCKHLKKWSLWGLLKADIADRGIPWTQLMLRLGRMPNSLNVSTSQRVSVLLVGSTMLTALLGLWWPVLWLVAAAMALAVTLINRDFYRFFLKHRGPGFTVCVLPMHWLYFVSCGLSVVVGTMRHYLLEDQTSSLPRQLGSLQDLD